MNVNIQHENVNPNISQPTPGVFPVKRGRGRPKGSKNKPKFVTSEPREGWTPVPAKVVAAKKPSRAIHRKWQREWIRPNFMVSRKQAVDIFVKHLRSAQGRAALQEIISDGFVGISKMPDATLGKYLEKTNLLSRYPHEVTIRG